MKEPKRLTKRGMKTSDGASDLKRYNVMLDEETVKKGLQEGNGNLSLGIRKKFKQ